MNEYQIGDGIRLFASFTDVNGTLTNPSSIFLRVVVGSFDLQYTWPVTTAIQQSGVGSFFHPITVETPGEHWYYWRAYGTVEAGEYGAFMVHTPPSPFV